MMSLNEFILDGVNFVRVSTAGYARSKPYGTCISSLRIIPVNAQARLPPAESPATKILRGLMLKYLWIWVDIKLYASKQSIKGVGNLNSGGLP